MAAPTITSAAASESGNDVLITFSAAMNQIAKPSGLTVKLNGNPLVAVGYLWVSTTAMKVRLIRCAAKGEVATIALASCNLSDAGTSTPIANNAAVSVTNGSAARLLRSHSGARLRY